TAPRVALGGSRPYLARFATTERNTPLHSAMRCAYRSNSKRPRKSGQHRQIGSGAHPKACHAYYNR
ncbi:hypothetical protein, partial [Salinivibrio socompensis]|uniref:hypothetical protein n=1 Tax=Salinivibrio socompensis TaxID=1510206 RepID=UPI001969FB10